MLPVPESVPSNVQATFFYCLQPELTGPVWLNYITPALEAGKLKCLPEPLIVGKGLESIQKGLDIHRKGVSAKKVVIEL